MEDVEYLAVIDADNIDNDLWFASWYTNGIFKFNLDENRIEFIDYFKDDCFIKRYIRNVRCFSNEVFFFNMFNFMAGNIGVVDLNVNNLEQKGYLEFKNEKDVYHDIILMENTFIIVPCDVTEPLIVFDIESRTSREICNWIAGFKMGNKRFGKMVRVGEYFYATCLQTNQLLRLNSLTLKADMITINNLLMPLNQLISDGKGASFFATGFQANQFLEWKDGKVRYLSLPSKDYNVGRGALCCNKLYLFPDGELHDIVVYQVETEKVYTLPIPENIHILPSRFDMPLFGIIKVVGEKVIALPCRVDGFLIIDALNDDVSFISSRIDMNLAMKSYYKSNLMIESTSFMLSDYLYCIDCLDR